MVILYIILLVVVILTIVAFIIKDIISEEPDSFSCQIISSFVLGFVLWGLLAFHDEIIFTKTYDEPVYHEGTISGCNGEELYLFDNNENVTYIIKTSENMEFLKGDIVEYTSSKVHYSDRFACDILQEKTAISISCEKLGIEDVILDDIVTTKNMTYMK